MDLKVKNLYFLLYDGLASPFNIIIIILLETSLELLAPSPPHYRNYNLEQIITNHKDGVELDLCYKRLTDQDMEIVAYYLLRKKKVSQNSLIRCHYRKQQHSPL